MSPYRSAITVLTLMATVVAGCSSSRHTASAPSTPAQTPTGTASDDPTSVPNQPAPTLPPVTPHKVKRAGQLQAPTISAAPAPFSGRVSYPDGVSLRVGKVDQGETTGSGPGALPGRPRTGFTVELTNRSTKPIDMNRVVVTVTYGSLHSQALPIYDAGVHDFSGTAQPGGGTVTGYYAFSIPPNQLTDVTMTVDFDGLHASATFDGSAWTR